MNDIINILGLEDDSVQITNIAICDMVKTITVEKVLVPTFCPVCGGRMHSKGITVRTINHPVLQDGFQLVIQLKQRRWKCTLCKNSATDAFKFVSPYKHSTNVTDLLILEDIRNLNMNFSDIANKFNVSDTYVHNVFDRYVDMDRLPLTEIICIDEVFTDVVTYSKYSMVILDFLSGQPIDILPSRQEKDTTKYFHSIPYEERCKVKYIVTDMYNPYLAYAGTFFPKAVPAIDSYHVIQWLMHRLNLLLIHITKEYERRDEEYRRTREEDHKPLRKNWISDEVYLLKKHRWVLLKNQDDIDYNMPSHKDYHFGYYMDTYMYENAFLNIHPEFTVIRELKEKYIRFNRRNHGDPSSAKRELLLLIDEYRKCSYPIFRAFADLLDKYLQEIINSFIIVEKYDLKNHRLSSGIIESFNRKPKDIRRSARGYRNFDHMRNRLLYATRTDPAILGIPKTLEEIRKPTGIKRGPYKMK